MILNEALACADAASVNMWSRPSEVASAVLAAEVRRLQSATCKDCSLGHMADRIAQLEAEVTALRLYAPAHRAGAMQPPAQIAPTNFAYWMN